MKMGKYSGIMFVVLAQLGIVLFAALFSSIMTQINNLRYGPTTLTSYIAFDTILSIAPTVLWLGGMLGAGVGYYKGYSIVAGKDEQGFMRMIMGVLTLVLFVTLFGTVLSNVETVRTGTNVSNYIAFATVIGISPTVLFLGGIFASISSGVAGVRANRRRKKSYA